MFYDKSVEKEVEIREGVLRFLDEQYGSKTDIPAIYGIDLFAMYDHTWDDGLVALILQLEGLQEANADETEEYRIALLCNLEKEFLAKMHEIRHRKQSHE